MEGKLKIEVDKTKFYGLESVADAIDHLLSGKNIGKVTVSLIKDSKL
jgi:NADPH-dependent curcumin reductase CurA